MANDNWRVLRPALLGFLYVALLGTQVYWYRERCEQLDVQTRRLSESLLDMAETHLASGPLEVRGLDSISFAVEQVATAATGDFVGLSVRNSDGASLAQFGVIPEFERSSARRTLEPAGIFLSAYVSSRSKVTQLRSESIVQALLALTLLTAALLVLRRAPAGLMRAAPAGLAPQPIRTPPARRYVSPEDDSHGEQGRWEYVGQQLAVAQNAATDARGSRDRLLANVSHEMRTPLTSILGYVELLRADSLLEGRASQCLEIVQKNAVNLLDLVNDLLAVAKSSRPTSEDSDELLDVSEVIREVYLSLAVESTKSVKAVEVELPEREVRARLNRRLLRQIVTNLLANAIKFTEQGTIVVRLSRSGPSGLVLEVEDSGIGIAPDHRTRIFEPFFKVDHGEQEGRGGSGLGLAIVKENSDTLGGRIEVESIRGSGSTFRLVLPTVLEEDSTPPDQTDKALASKSRRGRVLVVDDAVDIHELIGLYLDEWGFDFVAASDGREGATLALEEERAGRPFALILMDMQMPRMNGYAATRFLRCNGYKGTIIAITAHTRAGEQADCLGAGCDFFVPKPLDFDALAGLVSRAMGGAQARSQYG